MSGFLPRLSIGFALATSLGWWLPLHIGAANRMATLKSLEKIKAGIYEVRADAPFQYQTYQASLSSIWIDLGNSSPGSVPRSGNFRGAFVGYRIATFNDASGKPVVRIHLLMKQPTSFRLDSLKDGLRISLEGGNVAPLHTRRSGITLNRSKNINSSSHLSRTSSSNQKNRKLASEINNFLVPLSVIQVNESLEKNGTQIKIETSRPGPFKVLHLSNPPRLVVDLMGARSQIGRFKTISTVSPFLKQIRLAQFRDNPAVVRVVADLVGAPNFRVQAVVGGVQIHLRSRTSGTTRRRVMPSESEVEVTAGEDRPQGVFRTNKTLRVFPLGGPPL